MRLLPTVLLACLLSGCDADSPQPTAPQTALGQPGSQGSSPTSDAGTSTPAPSALTPNAVAADAATSRDRPHASTDDESQPRTSGPPTLQVRNADEFTQAIENAKPGDTIEIPSGTNIEGNFVLPYKDNPEKLWITITSSRGGEFVAGHRVRPRDARKMARITTTKRSSVLGAAPRSNYWRIVGLEIATDAPQCFNLCTFGRQGLGGSPVTRPDDLPHHITFRHCYIHGAPQNRNRVGIEMNAREFVVRDCYISDFHEIGNDSQALLAWNSPGPFTIHNNYLEGAGENIMFGGVDPLAESLRPADISFRNNYVRKPRRWYKKDPSWDGINHSVKNLLELKDAKRIVMAGNIFENSWAHSQVGYAILFTPRGLNTRVEDVVFENNIIKNCAGGINISSQGASQSPRASRVAKNITIRNNLVMNINAQVNGGGGRLIEVTTGSREPLQNLVIEHNTMLHGGPPAYKSSTFFTIGDRMPHGPAGFIFRNNLVSYGKYGFHGSSRGSGIESMNHYLEGRYVFSHNGIIHTTRQGQLKHYPATTIAALDAHFINASQGNFRLADGSPFKGRGSEGKDLGVDMDELVAETVGVIEGISPYDDR